MGPNGGAERHGRRDGLRLKKQRPASPSLPLKGGRSRLSRRRVLALSTAALGAMRLAWRHPRVISSANAAETIESHGLSAFSDPACPPDFFPAPYANPNAPTGDVVSQNGPDHLY